MAVVVVEKVEVEVGEVLEVEVEVEVEVGVGVVVVVVIWLVMVDCVFMRPFKLSLLPVKSRLGRNRPAFAKVAKQLERAQRFAARVCRRHVGLPRRFPGLWHGFKSGDLAPVLTAVAAGDFVDG